MIFPVLDAYPKQTQDFHFILKMTLVNKLSRMLLFLLVLSSIPPNFCQLALASTSYISDSINFPRKPSALAKGFSVRDTRSKALFPKYSDLRSSSSFNINPIESEIAAIFQEFAYGSSTSSLSSLTAVSSDSTPLPVIRAETSTIPIYLFSDDTKPKTFIGKQREVLAEVKVTTEKPVSISQEKLSSTNSYIEPASDSVFTYLLNTDDYIEKTHVNTFSNGNPKPVINNHPEFNFDENNLNDVQVRVTSVSSKKGYGAIQQEIGKAWVFHVYLTGISFGIVATVCLLSLSRISTCSQLLPRGYFITLHLMVFFASFLRCLLFLHDPYGAYSRLPTVLTSLLFNSVDPCLTTAYSIVLLVLLRAARIRLVPLNMQSPLVLATLCGIHIGGSVVIDVSSGVLEDKNSIETLNITTQAITVAWGTILCLGYVVSFSGVEKAAHRQKSDFVRLTINRKTEDDNTIKKNMLKPSLIYAARLFLICTLLHGLLIAFIILNLVTTKVPKSATSSEAWAWWTQTSLERIVEISLCILLLATALVLTQSKARNGKKDREGNIFSIFSNCAGGSKGIANIDVYPVANEKCNILGTGSMRLPSSGSLSYSKNGWRQVNDSTTDQNSLKNQVVLSTVNGEYRKTVQQDCIYNPFILFSPLQILHNNSTLPANPNNHGVKNHGNYIKETTPSLCRDVRYYDSLNKCNKTISGSNYYCSQMPTKNSKHPAPECNTIRGSHYSKSSLCSHTTLPVFSPSSNVGCSDDRSPTQHCHNYKNDYEIAPYYTHSNPNASYVYSKPYSPYPSSNAHTITTDKSLTTPCHLRLYRSNDADPKSEISTYSSSQSEIHVDYLTDASSSNDGLGNSLSRSLTLPICNRTCPPYAKDLGNGEINECHVSGPTSRLIYSQHLDVLPPKNAQQSGHEPDEAYHIHSSGVLSINTNLSGVPREQSGISEKAVAGKSIHYTPLTRDEPKSSQPTQEYQSELSNIKPETSVSEALRNISQSDVCNVTDNGHPVFSIEKHPVTSI